MRHYIHYFAELDGADNMYTIEAENFFAENVPVFRCSDKELELMYYFRWWTFYKHIKRTPQGYVITEFLPEVPWAGKYNTVNFPAGVHIMEARWLRDPCYAEDSLRFWFTGGGALRSYTTWLEYAAWQFNLVWNKDRLMDALLPHMAVDYAAWEKSVGQFAGLRENGLFEAIDDREGTEFSISGNGYRHQINGAMLGNCIALAHLFPAGSDRDYYVERAAALKQNICEKLWNEEDSFFEVLHTDGKMSGVRELGGYTPWYFTNMPEQYTVAWKFLTDKRHFTAPYGYTYADQSHSEFQLSYEGHPCQWNGPSWPMATSMTLTSMANLLHGSKQNVVTARDFCEGMRTYIHSQFITIDGVRRPWIDENLHPYTGDWMSRTMLYAQDDAMKDRGKDYNHSSFADLVISGLVGLRVDETGYRVEPLCQGWLDWFSLEGVIVKDKSLSIYWDKNSKQPRIV